MLDLGWIPDDWCDRQTAGSPFKDLVVETIARLVTDDAELREVMRVLEEGEEDDRINVLLSLAEAADARAAASADGIASEFRDDALTLRYRADEIQGEFDAVERQRFFELTTSWPLRGFVRFQSGFTRVNRRRGARSPRSRRVSRARRRTGAARGDPPRPRQAPGDSGAVESDAFGVSA